MTPATRYAYERLAALHEHADLQAYGPDMLISDVEAVVAALAELERENAALRERLRGEVTAPRLSPRKTALVTCRGHCRKVL